MKTTSIQSLLALNVWFGNAGDPAYRNTPLARTELASACSGGRSVAVWKYCELNE